ncbi:hypothetical protein B0T18DRAFT_116483 [Schizothecium vesticola]|uniref:Uncharacterized protein n=1 Tax=Schizothecium vesticola TaxID=314040 RepID=A0AA40F263_9PEZI|nr:hypothetical protein B0T18DRAFT_116483 [Schizothecium vesticola]
MKRARTTPIFRFRDCLSLCSLVSTRRVAALVGLFGFSRLFSLLLQRNLSNRLRGCLQDRSGDRRFRRTKVENHATANNRPPGVDGEDRTCPWEACRPREDRNSGCCCLSKALPARLQFPSSIS